MRALVVTVAMLAATASPASAAAPTRQLATSTSHAAAQSGDYTDCGEQTGGDPQTTSIYGRSFEQGRMGSYMHNAKIYLHGAVLRSGGGVTTVTVEQKPIGATNWIPVGTARTDRDGMFTFVTRAHITSRFRFAVAANAHFVGCAREITGPPVQAGVHHWTKYQNAERGKKVTFVLDVDPAPRKVMLQWHDYPGGPGWRTLDVTTADRNGRATVSFTPKQARTYRLQIVLSGDSRAISGWTGPKFLTVK